MIQVRKLVFLVYALLAGVAGALLLAMPGRFLGALGWEPVDPLLSRVLGAGLLALAWAAARGWQARTKSELALILEVQAIFCTLGALGLIRHLAIANYPLMVWLPFVAFMLFAVAWIVYRLNIDAAPEKSASRRLAEN